jgi:hypothetical protein
MQSDLLVRMHLSEWRSPLESNILSPQETSLASRIRRAAQTAANH